MLVCRNVEYVKIAKFAISSFLKFNKDYKIVLHADKSLAKSCKRILALFPSSRLELLVDIPSSGYPYEIKGELILKLQGTHDIFLDVDTRTNGPLPQVQSPLTLVAEFRMKDNVNFKRILTELGQEKFENCFLLNVTLVCWGGIDMKITIEEFKSWSEDYSSINWEGFLEPDQISYFKRFVEQIFFSIKFQTGNFQVLKQSDFVGDKGLVESSYFGASGYRFGR